MSTRSPGIHDNGRLLVEGSSSRQPTTIDVRDRLHDCGVFAVMTVDDPCQAVSAAQALLAGGIDVVELTLRTPAAVEAIRVVREEVPEMAIGAGTVLTPEQIDQVLVAGAHFAVAPGFNARVLRAARDAGLWFAPGVATPSEVEAAIELGCRELKFFPAEPSGGLEYLRCMNAPYAHLGVSYMPLGGLSIANAQAYLAEPSVLALGGSWVAGADLIRSAAWQEITEAAAEAVAVRDRAREQQVG